jgi:folylpolyglutamate synthase/dihydropteroate synthase
MYSTRIARADDDASAAETPLPADANIAPVAGLLADRARATMLLTLSDGRALPAGELARRAGRFFASTEVVEEPAQAVARGRELAGSEDALLVTGSLYLLADLS